jgi:hypothetical protein
MSQDTAVRPKIRLLHCYDCRTLEELPDFSGPPEYDTILEVALSNHETNGIRHVGKLYDVEERVWKLKNLRNTLIEQIKGGGSMGLAAIDPKFYEVRETFKDDALKCYKEHLRPKDGCSDWRSDSKRLVPPTKKERSEVGLSMEGAPRQWLCNFCPVRAFYERKAQETGS